MSLQENNPELVKSCVILQLNTDEVLKKIQLLGQNNVLIFVLQVKF